MSCPDAGRLAALVALELDAGAERSLREHLGSCSPCSDAVRDLDPCWIFTALPRRTLPPAVWAEVHRTVRLATASAPRSRPGLAAWVGRWVTPARTVPAVALAAAVILALTVGQLGGPPEVAVEGTRSAVDPMDRADGSAASSGFRYLSNPRAQVSHVLVAGEGASTVQVTMVIDETLGDIF